MPNPLGATSLDLQRCTVTIPCFLSKFEMHCDAPLILKVRLPNYDIVLMRSCKVIRSGSIPCGTLVNKNLQVNWGRCFATTRMPETAIISKDTSMSFVSCVDTSLNSVWAWRTITLGVHERTTAVNALISKGNAIEIRPTDPPEELLGWFSTHKVTVLRADRLEWRVDTWDKRH